MDLVQKIIIKATDKASAAMQRVRANSTGLAGALDKANKELKKLEGAEKKLAAYPGLKKRLAETKQAFRDNQRQQQALREEMRKTDVKAATIARILGLRAKLDQQIGWHKSISNGLINGVTGLRYARSFDLLDKNCEANVLNNNDITTLKRGSCTR